MICNLVARFAAFGEDGQLFVEHALELVGRHVGDTPVGLHGLQLVQTPVQLLQCLHSQPYTGTLLCKTILIREGLKKIKNKNGWIYPMLSDPSQPGKALDKKNRKFHNLFYVFIIFIITNFGENFEEKIDICFF